MKRRSSTHIVLAGIVLFALAGAGGCTRSGEPPSSSKLQVVTTLFPLYDFVRQVGKEKVTVSLLLPPGVESHGFEPGPEDMVRVSNADVFVYTNRFMEPWAGQIIKSVGRERGPLVIDASAGVRFIPLVRSSHAPEEREDTHGHRHSHPGGADPHIWLSITNAKRMVQNIAEGLSARDPENRSFYAGNAASFQAELDGLDRSFREGLADCSTRIFLHGGHSAFGYLAEQYGLTYVSAYPATADAEPTPRKFMEIISLMKKHSIRHIFYEEMISPRAASVIAAETGASLMKLHGLHNVGRDDLSAGATYISLMQKNLENLRRGLRCR